MFDPELLALVGMSIVFASCACVGIGNFVQTRRLLKWHRGFVAKCEEHRACAVDRKDQLDASK